MPVIVAPLSTASSTAGDLLNITRDRYLLSGQTEQRNGLAAAYTAGATTLAFRYELSGIQKGSILSVGMNTFYVWEVDKSLQTASVEPGYRGSAQEDADDGAVVDVNPRYPLNTIFAALNEEINALSSPGVGLYQMKTVEFPFNAAQVGFDLTGVEDITSIYEVRYDEPGAFLSTPRLAVGSYRLERNYAVEDNSSTYSLKMFDGGWPGQNVTVMYKAPFTPFATLGDALAGTGLPEHLLDLPPMGAALRLGVGREVRRNQTQSQGDTRRAEEVPPGAVAGSWGGLKQQRDRRIRDEVARLNNLYPYRR